jgi:hypothetical protein
MFRRGGGELAEEVRARRGDRCPGGADQRARKVVVWESDANSGETRSDESWDAWCCRRDDREWSRPEGVSKKSDAWIFECCGGEDEREIGAIGNVDDQRIKRWSPFRFKDARDCDRIQRVGTESVDRLGGEGDKAAST